MFLDGIKSWSYKGEFYEDKINGKGRFKWNEQKIYNGSWINNELSGYGILIDGNTKYIGYLEHNLKQGLGASFYNSNTAILGKWQNDLIDGYAMIILINNNNFEQNKKIEITTEENNLSSDDDKFNCKFVKTMKGKIIKSNLETDEIYKFKESPEYNEMIRLYKDKIYPDYQQNLDISKSEEIESTSSYGNY